MPSQFRPCSRMLGVLILIVIIALLLVSAADMHEEPYVRHQRRRFEVPPRQVGNKASGTRKAGSPNRGAPELETSTPPPSSISALPSDSSSASLPSSISVSSGPSSSFKPSSSSAFSSGSTSLVSSASLSSSASPSLTSSARTFVQSFPTPTPTPPLAPLTSHPILTTSSEPTPRTTLILAPLSSTTTALQTTTFSPSATSGALSGSSKGFWANKGAVAGTFTVVSVIGVGVIVALLVFVRRRAKNRRHREDEFYQSFAVEPEMAQSASGSFITPSAGGIAGSPAPTITELAAHTPMDPHVGNYGSSYTPQGLAPVQEQGSDPSHSATAPPVSSRRVMGRDSYQPSIDSFYGGR